MPTIEQLRKQARNLGIDEAQIRRYGSLAKKDTWLAAVEIHKISTGQSGKQIMDLLSEVEDPQAKAELEPILTQLARMSARCDAGASRRWR